VRAGYARKWGYLLTRRSSDTRHCAEKHEIEYNLELVRSIGADTRDTSLGLDVKDDIIKAMDARPVWTGESPVVAVHPYTSDSVKQWPYERFKDLIIQLRSQCNVQVAVVGKPDPTAPQAGYWNEGIDLTGRTTLPELAALLKRSRCLVSCDSGPVHLASCVGVPSVVLFRSDLPGKTARRWGPVSQGSVVIERSRLEDIRVDEVLGTIKRILKEEKS
jgi:ADP-heptose:LPS heptosyltransferase